jgi:pimeloyl-ACP methyl ester carboxylesterase
MDTYTVTGVYRVLQSSLSAFNMTIVSILSFALPLLSSALAAVSPQSVGSDLTIITHNDLYGNATTRPAAAIALSTHSIYSDAETRCAALGTAIWDPDGLKQDLGFLRYLDHGSSCDDGVYWVKSLTAQQCRAITTNGIVKDYSCDTQLPALCSNTATSAASQVSVTTSNATITGIRDRQAFRFLGLKYASIPARFTQSIYVPPTSNITALQYGPTCIQSGCKFCSEDCLTLNIWTPFLPNGKVKSNKKKAVMLWIYGGGFVSGSASDTTFDGSAMASRGDVVMVTVNYRLGSLGFLALGNTTLTGNYGLRDQNTALDWLHANIEAFGGDRDRITVFGQSAGAASVRVLLASPQAQNKVAGAIMMSTPQGAGPASTYNNYMTIAGATSLLQGVLEETKCANASEVVACLRKVDALDFVKAGRTVARYVYNQWSMRQKATSMREEPDDRFTDL